MCGLEDCPGQPAGWQWGGEGGSNAADARECNHAPAASRTKPKLQYGVAHSRDSAQSQRAHDTTLPPEGESAALKTHNCPRIKGW